MAQIDSHEFTFKISTTRNATQTIKAWTPFWLSQVAKYPTKVAFYAYLLTLQNRKKIM